jgi:hypothetical protein
MEKDLKRLREVNDERKNRGTIGTGIVNFMTGGTLGEAASIRDDMVAGAQETFDRFTRKGPMTEAQHEHMRKRIDTAYSAIGVVREMRNEGVELATTVGTLTAATVAAPFTAGSSLLVTGAALGTVGAASTVALKGTMQGGDYTLGQAGRDAGVGFLEGAVPVAVGGAVVRAVGGAVKFVGAARAGTVAETPLATATGATSTATAGTVPAVNDGAAGVASAPGGLLSKAKESFKEWQKSVFKPVDVPTTVKAADVIRQTENDIAALKQLGVEVRARPGVTHLQANVERWKETTLEVAPGGKADYGKLFNVEKLPPAGKATGAGTNAFLHPEMAAYKAKLESMGYRLTVDSSLPFTGAGGYHAGHSKIIALSPHSTWGTFVHEFQHAEFAQFVARDFEAFQAAVGRGHSVRELLPQRALAEFSPEKLDRLQKLMDKGLPSQAVNESLSVAEQLKAMGFRRYLPGAGSGEAKYALKHQVTELNAIVEGGGKLTDVQARTLAGAKRRHAALAAYEKGTAAAAIVGVGTAGIAVPGAVYDYLHDPSSYAQIIYDTKGNAFGQQPDGSWVYLRR